MADLCSVIAHSVRRTPGVEIAPTQKGLDVSSSWRFLIAASALGATVLLMHARNNAEIIPARQPLSSFPATLNGWNSTDLALPKEVLDVLGPGDFLLRRYQNSSTNSLVDMFIAYFPS